MADLPKTRQSRTRSTVLLAAGIALGIALTATPAATHVGGTVGHLWRHIKPRADARYLQKVARPRQTFSGQISVRYTPNAGFVLAQGSYPVPLPARTPVPTLEYRPPSLPTRGRLCIYVVNETNILGAALATTGGGESKRFGFGVAVYPASPAALGALNASWAYTVP